MGIKSEKECIKYQKGHHDGYIEGLNMGMKKLEEFKEVSCQVSVKIDRQEIARLIDEMRIAFKRELMIQDDCRKLKRILGLEEM